MPVISVTRLRVRSWRFLLAFFLTTIRIGRQARNAKGNLAVLVFHDRRNAFWTSTAWDSEASMRAFMLARPHGPTMRRLLDWCDEAALVHWTQENDQLPDWSDARTRMLGEGRTSKVNHPSDAQKAFRIDEPVANRRSQLRLK